MVGRVLAAYAMANLALKEDSNSRSCRRVPSEREFFIDNLLVRIHYITVMIMCTGLAPWEFEFPSIVIGVGIRFAFWCKW